jgi:hypothetical protein
VEFSASPPAADVVVRASAWPHSALPQASAQADFAQGAQSADVLRVGDERQVARVVDGPQVEDDLQSPQLLVQVRLVSPQVAQELEQAQPV